MTDKHLHDGEVVASFGRQYLVESDQHVVWQCVTRAKRHDLACGDRVEFLETAVGEGVIEKIKDRDNFVRRAAFHRQKNLAANVTQVAIITAMDPAFSDELVARVIIAATAESVPVLIVLNKVDLADTYQARDRLAALVKLGYPLIELAALDDILPLRQRLTGERTVLIGQSGMGKSTIVNALLPDANAATNEISKFLASGRHTTTASRLYRLDHESALIDCPGMQEFGLAHLDKSAIAPGFKELDPYLGRCRFADCRHEAEPDCAVKTAVSTGAIDARRFELFQRITAHPS